MTQSKVNQADKKEEHTQHNMELIELITQKIAQLRTTMLQSDYGVSNHEKVHLTNQVERIRNNIRRVQDNA